MEKMNIRQIAQKAGVSAAAVSYAINGKPGVSKETRERILAVIRESGFTPNENSRRLSFRRSFNIVLVTDPASPMTNLFYSAIVGALLEGCTKRGYHLVMSAMTKDFSASDAYKAVRQSNADGLVFLSHPNRETRSLVEQEKMPYVVVDDHAAAPAYPCVRADYGLAAQTAVEFLAGLGHRRIGFIGRGDMPEFFESSGLGYRSAMERLGLPVEEGWLAGSDGTQAGDIDTAKRMLGQKNRPTAVVCAGDLMALAGMSGAHDLGLHVPEEVSFVGIDDLPISALCFPKLTTVHIDAAGMGEAALELIDRQIEGETGWQPVCVPSGELVRRESAAPMGKNAVEAGIL